MAIKELCPAHAALATQVDELLQSITGELSAAVNPHRLALRSLGIDGMGWTKVPHSAEAFKIWSEELRRQPEDIETLHHLAIMYHARAIDLEAGGDFSKANADWEAALSYWHRLWQRDDFWTRLADLACKNTKTDAVDALRHEFPVLLLQVHYDIAFQADTKNHRSRFHIDLVPKSPFPKEAIAAVRRTSYTRAISNVPPTVWQINELNPDTIKQGTDAIKGYLELDPGCVPALEDALRLQVRLLRARYTDLQASGDDESPERTRLLNTLKRDVEEWGKYLDQLVPLAKELEESIRQKLCLWYRVMGEVYRALDKHSEAIKFYEQGVKAGAPEDDEHKRCVRALGETHAYLAREKAGAEGPDARAYCDQVAKRPNLSIRAHFLLANAYSVLHEFDLAKKICTKGLQIQPDESETDPDNIAAFEQGQHHLRDMLGSIDEARRRTEARKLLDKATEHLQAERFGEALAVLNKAATAAPREGMVYFLRCQCHLALDRIAEARRDLETFHKSTRDAEGAGAAVARLEKELKIKEGLLDSFGAESLRLRSEATECFQKEQFARASDLLRKALAGCPAKGRKELQKELAIVLTNWAGKMVNEAMEDKTRPPAAKESVCRDALAKLEEANKLDASNTHVKENLQSLRELLSHFKEMMDFEKKKAELLAQYGTEEALKLQQQAIVAFNADRHEEAIKLLRRALIASGGKERSSSPLFTPLSLGAAGLRSPTIVGGAQKLREELSMVLTQTAISKANAASGYNRDSTLAQAEAMLTDAVDLDSSNTQAEENLKIVKILRNKKPWEL